MILPPLPVQGDLWGSTNINATSLLSDPVGEIANMPSGSHLGIDEVFLDSCISTSIGYPISPASLTTYKFAGLSVDEDNEPVQSNAERLSVFYANAAYDFYGTPSGALCVYKNGDAWPVRTGPESQRIIREARGVHGHPMQTSWPELGRRACNLLDEKKVTWTSMDSLAFAEAGMPRFSPLLIWIGVEPKSLAYALANIAAEAVNYFLTQAGFSDFEIGFRESVVTRAAAGPKMLPFDPFIDSIPEFRKPFTPTLGLYIAPFKTPQYEGTGVLYLRESNESNRTMSHYPREHVIALGYSGYTNALKSMMVAIGDQHRSIKDWEAVLCRLGEPKEGEPANITNKRNEHLDLRWTVPDQRIIGEVFHVEPIGVNVAPHGDTVDWAAFKGNKVYVGGNLSSLDYGKTMFPRPEDQADYEYPQDGLLQASGVITPDQIHNPTQLDAQGEQSLLVVKNGLTTGTTIGRVTGMDSFTCTFNEYGIKETSMEIAVLPYGNVNGPFSAPGDSGAIVLDRNGGILGMVNGGAGTDDRTDITYLTPYWYLEAEIKKYFPDSFLYA
ncbi:hypothetical protein BD410DRAFT_812777 [Rickenella mellea]|uniref:Peptidase S1 domain-containing protein n=1 Tax=Rickenella mellea TaxID=50990 RepID=A0A4Y7QII2_9AGAM|nr:hypothetical protein BD410DRAFT_812777 [Rickenella mellea]